MELRQLEAFVAVAEERSFTKAASRLFVAQSGLSATVRALERELRTGLFVRTTRRVDLTPAGAALLVEARRTLAAARAAVDAVDNIEGLRRGTLAVGVIQASGAVGVARLLARYREAYPGITLRLHQANSTVLLNLLRDGMLDLVFASEAEEPSPEIVSRPVLETPLVVVGRPDRAELSPARLTIGEAAEHQIVGFPRGWGVRALVDRLMTSAGLEPRVDLEVNDTLTLLDLVEVGLGIAMIPISLAALRPQLDVSTLAGGPWNWVVAAQTLAPAPMNPAGRALWAMIEDDLAIGPRTTSP